MELFYYNPNVVAHEPNYDLPGMKKFSYFFSHFFGPTMIVVDRTNTISIPVHVKPISTIPKFRMMTRSFEELCDERAVELLSRAQNDGIKLYVLWSGGIDSTLVLVSLLKNATAEQKKRIVVLLSEESIVENPRFYESHIRGKLQRESSNMFPHILGTSHIFVSGELNDQLFGAAAPGDLMAKFGDEIVHKPFQRSLLFEYYNNNVQDAAITNFYLDMFDRVITTSPVPITSYLDYFWWINFTLKWQSVYMRILSFAAERNVLNITTSYLKTNFAPFYDTEEFQLWSMNNLDKRIKDTWNTYKWPCKEIIYNYTKDADYRDNKLKRGSLFFILLQQNAYNFINTSMDFSRELPRNEYYNPDNEFVS